jgi:hypothetical protein
VASLTLVKMLFCGQGMMTLVEVYDDGVEKPAADFLALIDCGGELEYAQESLTFVTEKVRARTPPTLDCVVISHQDSDHVRLLKSLGALLEPLGATVTGPIFVGGEAWNREAAKVGDFLKAVGRSPSSVQHGSPGQSDYTGKADRSQLTHIARHGDVFLRLLVSNLRGAGRNVANSSSAVVVVENGSYSVVLPGDATFETMLYVNLIGNLKALLPPVIGCSLPHHGALATSVENYKSGKALTDFNWKIIEFFAQQAIAARRVAASAGPWNSHHHPVDEVINVFLKDNPTVIGEHSYVVYLYETEYWKTHRNDLPVECTVRTIAPDTLHAPRTRQKRKAASGDLAFTPGDIVFKLAPVGVLKPDEMVEFRPRRSGPTAGPDEVVVPAPEA